ncbi:MULTISPECIES: glycogen debranching N-terminal domain-containing protein [unclassified Streptomyces]|uniref:amylo-alpha-1,6-glucosidase n=1 Tax=unclassified Streptomyces TaxID=2593676 RepID=UPI000DB9803B|nr:MULTISPECIES: glycogen debranching N-terminal domain-containing protein [unclassified Streptomyces]MYT73151.1 aminotransferase [Streptomyces sp. SID8367]RAJ73612.1 glycogen debranching enzyme [Streptomyces sp. PsTaAH-137]
MTETFGGNGYGQGQGRTAQLLIRGGTFAALDAGGGLSAVRGAVSSDGLFVRDARHLSRWQLTVDGSAPEVLTPLSYEDGGVARCVLVPRGGRQEPPAYTLFREQALGDGSLVELLRIVSNRPVPTTVRVALTVDADFADQFELRSDHRTYTKTGAVRTREALDDGVEFTYTRGDWRSSTTVTSDPAPEAVEETGTGARRLVWALELPAQGSAGLTLRVAALPSGGDPVPVPASPAAAAAELASSVAEFSAGVELPGAWPELATACSRGLADLAVLRVPAAGPDGERHLVPAAGVPWFLALLGRDALLTSLFALPYRPELAAATLPVLAAAQATEQIEGVVAQPGKIVHEVRHGELAHFGQVPYGRYYGSVDATPLFLVLLGAYTERTGDSGLARRLESHARAAVGWMLDHGGLTSRGYLVYRADQGGLANQNWKDSPGAICSADGSRATGPVMAAGAQGYAYDALRRTAVLARTVWDDVVYAELLEQAAADLRDRFVRDFWMPEKGFPALALDGDGRQVDALASDAGHLLWSGLLDKEYGAAVGRRLLEPDFFSGWGVRTVAAGQPAYHPLSYHRGSVWPHDNALIALGLARYGLHDEARVIAGGVVAAAVACGGRLPEVVAGYARDAYPAPVPFPYACARESRSAAAPLALLSAVGG